MKLNLESKCVVYMFIIISRCKVEVLIDWRYCPNQEVYQRYCICKYVSMTLLETKEDTSSIYVCLFVYLHICICTCTVFVYIYCIYVCTYVYRCLFMFIYDCMYKLRMCGLYMYLFTLRKVNFR